MRKGFYFSFDAFLALLVMSASLVVVSQSSDLASDQFESSSISYREASTVGQDAMKLASRQTFQNFNDSFRQDLKDETVMTSEDMDRTILDGISLLWAARNISYAKEATKRYFGSKLGKYEYRLQVNEDGNRTVIYETSEIPPDAKSVSSISRLVSGHKIDRPSEGFQARARITSLTKNVTRLYSIPAMGNAHENGKMEVWKEFKISNPEKIYKGTLYINVEYNSGQSVEQLTVNGVQKKTDLQVVHDNGDTIYAKVDVTDALEPGRNGVYIRMKGKGSQDEPNEFQPGSMIRVKFRKDTFSPEFRNLRHERIYFENISAETQGGAEPGIFKVESFEIPRNAEFVNATVQLNATHLDTSNCGYSGWWYDYDWDVKTIINGEVLDETCASGEFNAEYSLSQSQVKNGTNVFTVYLENYGNTFWGGDRTGLFSNFQGEKGSHIDVWYRVPEDSLRYGEIKVTTSEVMGGGVEEPKIYEKMFEYKDLARTEVYIAQKYSNTVHLDVDDGSGYEEVFESPGVRATPTRITVSPGFYDTSQENKVRLSDSGPDIIKFYPESRFQWTVWVPSQVGYGKLFENKSAAVKDARQRLKNRIGDLINAKDISSDSLSTGNQPYLWGPALVKLVVWRD